MENVPLVSVITINYNQSAVTAQLLESLNNLTYKNKEVFVIDNGSPTDNPDWLQDDFPWISLVKTGKNLGFAGGNNIGISKSKGDYLLFINNDTEVPPGFLEPLVEFMEKEKMAGMVSPKIKFHWDPTLIQYAGFTRMTNYTVRNKAIGYKSKDTGLYDSISETNSVHGAAMIVKREVVEKIGPMPDLYFLYYEEHDWAQMAKRAGYKLFYNPDSFILHKESVSTGKESPLKTYYLNRGRLIYTLRNTYGCKMLISIAFQFLVSLPKNSLLFLTKRDFPNLRAYWKAYLWILYNYKQVLMQKQQS
ncbi:MAG: glycosyltransferase family 2 protein [Bacteroidales bacterium]|nr:glycosyltransferase family 2 protein [Bacteroidales bacterium]MDD4619128.1 glycosyltransferase family 2 protein [Bacteroidales bacterium]